MGRFRWGDTHRRRRLPGCSLIWRRTMRRSRPGTCSRWMAGRRRADWRAGNSLPRIHADFHGLRFEKNESKGVSWRWTYYWGAGGGTAAGRRSAGVGGVRPQSREGAGAATGIESRGCKRLEVGTGAGGGAGDRSASRVGESDVGRGCRVWKSTAAALREFSGGNSDQEFASVASSREVGAGDAKSGVPYWTRFDAGVL